MDPKQIHKADIGLILSKRGHLEGDLWTTPDHRIGKGSPFSTRDVAIMLATLGFTREDPVGTCLGHLQSPEE